MTAIDTLPQVHRTLSARHVGAVAIGNAIEFYDFLTYSFFAVYIGKALFPAATPSGSLLLSLATFGVGFVGRPVGAAVIGIFGDRRGRRPALILSLMLMGVGIVGLALTPSYATIGIAAPILAVVFRLTQGFALGGQVGPATAFLVEAAPPHRRGLYCSFQYASQDLAIMTAGIVGTILGSTMNDQMLTDWGWRIALLLGSVAVPFGLWLRRGLPETAFDPSGLDASRLAPQDDEAGALERARHAEVRAQRAPKHHEHVPLRPYAALITLTIAMFASSTIALYTLTYMTTYALDTLRLPASLAFWPPIITGLLCVVFEPISGMISDHYGRKPIMLVPSVLLLFTVIPTFYWMSAAPGAVSLCAGTAILTLLVSLSIPSVLISFTETMPKPVRAGSVSIVYALAIMTFGGTAQPAIKWLIDLTHSPMAPAYYLTAAMAVGVIAMALTKESAPARVGQPSLAAG